MQYFCCKIYFLFISFGIATYFNFANYDFRSDLKKIFNLYYAHICLPPPPFKISGYAPVHVKVKPKVHEPLIKLLLLHVTLAL